MLTPIKGDRLSRKEEDLFVRNAAHAAISFLVNVVHNDELDIKHRIKAAKILATEAGVPVDDE